VSVRVAASGLAPGFHGYHVHTLGVCDPAATDAAGNPSPFFTAGGHYNPDTTATHGAHAGDMPPLLVAADGTGFLKFKTDRFTTAALMDSDRSAVVLHAGADNLAHVPGTTATGGERYHSHVDNIFGADTATKATGDAGARFACGVIERYTS
jgi:Cu-Zn family superoxide dismutase